MFSSLFHSSPSDLYVFSSRLLKHFFPRLEASTTTSDLTKRCDVTGGGWRGGGGDVLQLPFTTFIFGLRAQGEREAKWRGLGAAGDHRSCCQSSCWSSHVLPIKGLRSLQRNHRQSKANASPPTPPHPTACKAAHTCPITRDGEVPSLLGT